MIDPTTITTLRRLLGEATHSVSRRIELHKTAINALPALLDAAKECARLRAELDGLYSHIVPLVDDARAERDAAKARADAAEQSLLALRVELWDGVKAHGLRAPTEYQERVEGARLIHAYCGGIAEARNERDAAIARAADLDKRLTDLAPFLHAMCERAGRAEKALRELQRDELPTNCQHCGGVGAEPPGCPESGPCEQCGAWTTHKRLVAAQAATERARVAEEIAAWHDDKERLHERECDDGNGRRPVSDCQSVSVDGWCCELDAGHAGDRRAPGMPGLMPWGDDGQHVDWRARALAAEERKRADEVIGARHTIAALRAALVEALPFVPHGHACSADLGMPSDCTCLVARLRRVAKGEP